MKPWNVFWSEYSVSEAEAYYISRRDVLLQQLAANIPFRPIKILEAGCGYGSNIRKLQQAESGTAFALDLSLNAVRLVRHEVTRALAADLLNLPFSADSFDLTFNAGVVEHFRDPLAPMHEMLRVTRPGGWICVFVPGTFNLWQLYRMIKGANWIHGFEQAFSRGQMVRFARSLGLENTHSGGIDSFTLKGVLLKLAKVGLPFEVDAGFGYQEVFVYGKKSIRKSGSPYGVSQ